MASSAWRWKVRPRSSEYPAKFNSKAAVETCWGWKPRFICKACCRPRRERNEAETRTKQRATCTTTRTSRKARWLWPSVAEAPRRGALGSVREARQAGAEPASPAAIIEPARANKKTRQSTVMLNCTGKSMGARIRLNGYYDEG